MNTKALEVTGSAAAAPAGPAPRPELQAEIQMQVQALVRSGYVDLFLSQSRRAQGGLLASALLLAGLWFDPGRQGASRWWPLAWLALVLAVTGWRFIATESFVRAASAERAPGRIALLLALNGTLMALPLLDFGTLSDLDRAVLTVLLTALATASVATTTGYRSLFLAFAGPMLAGLALAWALSHSGPGTRTTHLGLGLLILVYLGMLFSVGRQTLKVFEDSCRIRFAEHSLNEKLQQALERESQAHRAKTQFLAAASHDLRQPIHSINVLVAALSLRDLDERSREIANLLGTVSQTLSQQLDALLDVSRLDAGTVRPQLQAVALDRLLARFGRTMEPVARERGLRLELGPFAPAQVLTDEALLLRVISNVTDNALKYTPSGGQVRLSLRCEDGMAWAEVCDNGIGIAPQEQPKVFAEFYQVDNVERDRTKGLGLGLSIVQRISALLQVQVQLQSEPQQGTTVRLGLALTGEVAAEGTAAPQTAQALSGLRVLIVDDEPQVLQSMELLLSQWGCVVHTASGSAQAQAIARAMPLDVVLSDLRLRAGDSGSLVLQGVRALQPGVRAALITGDTAPQRIRETEALGVDVLHKPVSANTLQQWLGAR